MDYTLVKAWLANHINKTYKNNIEFEYLHTLLKNHPSYNDWQLNIPLSFKIVKKKYLQLMVCFKIRYRIVSWVKCTNKIVGQINPLTSAMRHAIKRQISIYKNKNTDKTCCLCQSNLKIEVDHYPIKFAILKQNFILNHIMPTTFKYHSKRGYSMFNQCDILCKKAWQKYHLQNANYRYLCSTCNKKY